MKLLQRFSRTAAHTLALLFLALASLLAGLLWLGATESGLQVLAAQLTASLPGLSIQGVEGTLFHHVVLRDLELRDAEKVVRVGLLDLHWDPTALQHRTLHVQSLVLHTLRAERLGTDQAEPLGWPEWPLPLPLTVDRLSLLDASYRAEPQADPIAIDGLHTGFSVTAEGLEFRRFELSRPDLDLRLTGKIALGGARAVDLDTQWRLKLREPAWLGELRGAGKISGGPAALALRQRLEAPFPLQLAAQIPDPLQASRWSVAIDLPRLAANRLSPTLPAWPVAAVIQAEGTLEDFGGSLVLSGEVPDGGPANGRLLFRHAGSDRWLVEQLRLEVPRTGSLLQLAGKLGRLSADPEFEVDASWSHLLWPLAGTAQWRSPEGRLKLAGRLSEFQFDLNGRLGERPVRGGGTLGFSPTGARFRGVELRGAGVEVRLEGAMAENLDLVWTLYAEDLTPWWPGAEGRIQSQGRLGGTRSAPALTAELEAAGLRLGPNRAERLVLRLQTGLAADSPLQLTLQGQTIEVAGQRLQAELSAQGTRSRHRLKGTIRVEAAASETPAAESASPRLAAAGFDLMLMAEGSLAERLWSGNLLAFDVTHPTAGSFDLQAPTSLRIGGEGVELGLACWRHGAGRGCARGHYGENGDWQIAADLDELRLEDLAGGADTALTVRGRLSGQARFGGDRERLREGRLDLTVADGLVEIRGQRGAVTRIQPEPLALRLRLDAGGGRLDFDAVQSGVATLYGQVRLTGPLDPERWRSLPIEGRIQAGLSNLSLLQPWLEDISDLQGSFGADLQLEGQLGQPRLRLAAEIPTARFEVPQLGLAVRHFTLEARSAEDRQIRIFGRASSGSGQVRFDGTAHLNPAAGWPVELTVKGDRFLAADIPEAKVWVSPDLELTFADGRVSAKGRVSLPEAAILVPDQPGAIKPSADVVYVGDEAPAGATAFAVESRIEVLLGDKVKIQGYGFKGRLTGRLTVEQQPKGPVLGTGAIQIRDGKYSYYGVDLDIDDGRLMFAHSPIDNPNLAVNVTRKTDVGLVGVKVLGTLQKPEAQLYADRPMAQADILAYLVTGKPLGLASSSEGGMLRDAAATIGGPAGSFLAREISNRLGLGDFLDISFRNSLADSSYAQGFQTPPGASPAAGAQSTALFLGKYLTPRLYVQYGMGLFQNIYVFRVRYELTENWKIQTETGQYSGGDILYQWEH